jgi:hypothetical protein
MAASRRLARGRAVIDSVSHWDIREFENRYILCLPRECVHGTESSIVRRTRRLCLWTVLCSPH